MDRKSKRTYRKLDKAHQASKTRRDRQMTQEDLLKQQISALNVIINELNHFYAISADFQQSAAIRADINQAEEIRYEKQAKLDSLNAAQNLGSPVTQQEQAALTQALTSLDKYVRSDQSVSMCISYVTQIANAIGSK